MEMMTECPGGGLLEAETIREAERERILQLLAATEPAAVLVEDGDGWCGPVTVFDVDALRSLFDPEPERGRAGLWRWTREWWGRRHGRG